MGVEKDVIKPGDGNTEIVIVKIILNLIIF
jgi:hypothetical protein